MNYLGLLLFIISTLGYWYYLGKKTNINFNFIPGLTISIQVTLLFISGILNCLMVASNIILILGIVFFCYYLIKDNKELFKYFCKVEYIIFFLIFIVLGLVLKNKIFYFYDDFSHWALVVKSMLINNRFPNFLDTSILFQEYPLGSSVYVYYFAKTTSQSEGIQMLGQSFVTLCLLFSIFNFHRKNKINIFSIILILLFIDYIIMYYMPITTLLVDTLLGICGFYLISFTIEELKKEKPNILLIIPVLVFQMMIKNSGIFFVIIDIIIIINYMIKTKKIKDIKYWLTIVSPFVSLFIWKKHCSYVFIDAVNTKHSMNIDNFTNVFKEKSLDDIKIIIANVLKQSVSANNFLLLLFFIIIIGLLIYLFNKKNLRNYLKKLSYLLLIYIAYTIGLILMYIFSMPLEEAINLASISRYMGTIYIFIYLIVFVESINVIKSSNYRNILTIIIIISIIYINYFNNNKYKSILNINDNITSRIKLEESLSSLDLNKKIFVALEEPDAGYTGFLLRYLTLRNDNQTLKITYKKELDMIKKCDYLINQDKDNEIIKEYILEYYPDQPNNEIIIIKKESEV